AQLFFFASRRRHTRSKRDWSSDVCSSDLIPAGQMIGLIGPDGVGKSSLLSLVSGSRVIQEGDVWVMGGDMGQKSHRNVTCPRIEIGRASCRERGWDFE